MSSVSKKCKAVEIRSQYRCWVLQVVFIPKTSSLTLNDILRTNHRLNHFINLWHASMEVRMRITAIRMIRCHFQLWISLHFVIGWNRFEAKIPSQQFNDSGCLKVQLLHQRWHLVKSTKCVSFYPIFGEKILTESWICVRYNVFV